MPSSERTVHVFYSWQSDSPEKTNRNAIRKALKKACKAIQATESRRTLIPDEATRDTSGSPNIALKILEKVEAAAVFIADVTTITAPGSARPCPNPNVGYELGYAVATLGWDRVILLFNEAHGTFPGDLPFDFAQHRAKSYNLLETDSAQKIDGLVEFLQTAIGLILSKNPKRPAELKGLTREKIEHDHDVKKMKWIMGSLHLPTLDQHIDGLPQAISAKAMWYWENFKSVVANSLFSLYDPVLNKAVLSLFHAWEEAISHPDEYEENSGGTVHFFSNPRKMTLLAERQVVWNEIDKARATMREELDTILERLRSSYVEVDIDKTNKRAWRDYVAFIKETDKTMPSLARAINKAKKQSKK